MIFINIKIPIKVKKEIEKVKGFPKSVDCTFDHNVLVFNPMRSLASARDDMAC